MSKVYKFKIIFAVIAVVLLIATFIFSNNLAENQKTMLFLGYALVIVAGMMVSSKIK